MTLLFGERADAFAGHGGSLWRRGVEQLLHELEQKYFALKGEFSVAEMERQTLAKEKHAAGEALYTYWEEI